MKSNKGINPQVTLRLIIALALLASANLVLAAHGQEPSQPAQQPVEKQLYVPAHVWKVPKNNDYTDNYSEFSYERMVQSENVAIFWAKEYGDDPSRRC
jgi:Family of unknown function (DUF6055)